MTTIPPPKIPQRVQNVIRMLLAAGAAECMLVGGWVRDHLMGIDSKDIDLEVYGLGYDQIVAALRPRYRVNLVGKSFGVVKVGNWLDINIPRRESKFGLGHRGFTIDADPTMTPYEATARRDFTINAIGLRLDGSFHDPFDGRGDIERGLLRATTEAFKEDPLRVLRGMQFAARFGFRMEARTIAMSRAIAGQFEELSAERIWEEWRKWAAQGTVPSRGLEILRETHWVASFPELLALAAKTPGRFGADGLADAAAICDRAAEIARHEALDTPDRLALLFAALCHAFAEDALQGGAKAAAFLEKMRAPGHVVTRVAPLVAEQAALTPGHHPPSETDVRRLARRLQPATVRLWSLLWRAIAEARSDRPAAESVAAWTAIADRLGLLESAPEPILLGRHLIEMGVQPGPTMGRILAAAFEAQLDGAYIDVEGAKRWYQRYVRP